MQSLVAKFCKMVEISARNTKICKLCNFTHFSMPLLAVVIYLHLLCLVLKLVYNGELSITLLLCKQLSLKVFTSRLNAGNNRPQIRKTKVMFSAFINKRYYYIFITQPNLLLTQNVVYTQPFSLRCHPVNEKKCIVF